MQSFKEYLQEAHVYDNIHTEVKKDRIDFHHQGKLIHTHKGDFHDTDNKKHRYLARQIASRISIGMKGGKNIYGGEATKFPLNHGKTE